jgi:iron-sulfur cluster assembly accessory protein
VITISPFASEKLKALLAEEKKVDGGLRVFVQGGGCSGFQYGLLIEDDAGDVDQVFESNGIKMFVDPISISYLTDAVIDFEGSLVGGGFKINNPKAVSTCGCGSSFTV